MNSLSADFSSESDPKYHKDSESRAKSPPNKESKSKELSKLGRKSSSYKESKTNKETKLSADSNSVKRSKSSCDSRLPQETKPNTMPETHNEFMKDSDVMANDSAPEKSLNAKASKSSELGTKPNEEPKSRKDSKLVTNDSATEKSLNAKKSETSELGAKPSEESKLRNDSKTNEQSISSKELRSTNDLELNNKDTAKNLSLSEKSHRKSHVIPAITISEAANSKYRENLLNDIDVTFERKRTSKKRDKGNEDERKSVLNAVKAYETKLQQLYQHSASSGSSRVSQVYEEWTEVARKPPATPGTNARRFGGRRLLLTKRSESAETDKEEKDLLTDEIKQKLKRIAEELLSTEENYVSILYILDQIFYKQILEASAQNVIPSGVANSIFKHLSAIYLFHSTYLLPQLRERLKEWDHNPRIGDVMIQAAPFLRMYALYIENNAKAVETIQIWKEKSKEFANIIKKIEASTKSNNNPTLESHLLTPVQRTPRYRMLLENYLKKLPEKSTQRSEIESALEFVSFAADHSNNYIKSKEKSMKLVKVYSQLSIADFDVENCNRELLKEGKVIKIAARNGKKHDRYLYLFDDVLLCCKECSRLQRIHGKLHQVSVNFDLCGVTAFSNSSTKSSTFYVQGIEKQTEFLCSSTTERDSWVSAVNEAVAVQIEKHNTFRRARRNSAVSLAQDAELISQNEVKAELPAQSGNGSSLLQIPSARVSFPSQEQLGSRAPQWVKDQDVTMCMRCSLSFHPIKRRRHHCRACGRVVCSSCSRNALTLSFQPNSQQRVCSACFDSLTPTGTPNTERKKIKEWHDEEFELSDYLYYQEKDGSWLRLWCVVPKKTSNACLCFKAKMDVKPFMLLSLTGCDVVEKRSDKYPHSFQVKDIFKQQYTFGSDDFDVIQNWIKAIKNKSTQNIEANANTLNLV